MVDGSSESSSYNDFGDLIESKNSGVTYSYAYTAKHQLKKKTDSRQNKSLSWTYDKAGNLKTKTDRIGTLVGSTGELQNRNTALRLTFCLNKAHKLLAALTLCSQSRLLKLQGDQ